MKNKWFEQAFLNSLVKKAESNTKYKNQIVLSEKQADICHRYMNYRENYTNYGRIGYLDYNIDGYFCIVQNRGKYTFLNITKIVKNENKIKAKEIRKNIDLLENKLDFLYENKESNLPEIKSIENIINNLWAEYNEILKIK